VTPAILGGLLVAGAVGAVARHLVDGLVSRHADHGYPWGTLVVNVTGSLLLGMVTGAALQHGLPGTPAILLGTGLCGSYTTFSTFAFETIRLLEEGSPAGAVLNPVGHLLAGTGAAATGLLVASAV